MTGRPVAPMFWLALAMLSACSLYLGPPSRAADDVGDASVPGDGSGNAPLIDAPGVVDAGPPDAGPPSYSFAACSGGLVYASAPQPTDVAPADIPVKGTMIGQCHARCRAPGDVYACLGDTSCGHAAEWLCEPDPGCPADGGCSGVGTRSCSQAAGCAVEVVTETCACTGGDQVCTDPCDDGLCSPIQILHAIAGHWQGTVTPPSFAAPYQVDLVIAPDGHVSPHGLGGVGPAFYYGDDGGSPDRFFRIVGPSPSGAIGQVGVMFSPQEILPGLITGLHVDAGHLRFQFWDSWLACSREFAFDLTRVP